MAKKSKRKKEVEKVKTAVKKSTGTSRPSKYIGRQPAEKPASKTFKDPAKPKTPVKRSTRVGSLGGFRGGVGGGMNWSTK